MTSLRPIAIAVLLAASSVFAQQAPTRFDLTVYSNADPATFNPKGDDQPGGYYRPQPVPGYGLVRELRPIDLKAGANEVRFTDVAAGIDPTTVGFLSRTDPAGTNVLEQNYEFDLVSPEKLLEKYVDKTVIVERAAGDGKAETIEGTLLSAGNGLVIKTPDGGVRIVNGYTGIRVADAAGLITRPTLVWNIDASKAGKHDALVTYQTSGLTWRADYNIVLNEANTAADVGAWVTLVNKSGAAYPDARLKLVAGDVQRLRASENVVAAAPMIASRMKRLDDGFKEKSFFEYHLYTLGRVTSVPDNSTKQLELFDKKLDVPAKKVFVYSGVPSGFNVGGNKERDLGIEMNKKVDVYLSLDNKEANGLGIPLPAGRVRVYQRDDDAKSQEFVGEDVIQHIPKGETLSLKLGSAFDIVGERVQTAFKVDERAHSATESFRITLRNHKKEAVKVIVKENLYRWLTWEISAKSDAFEQQDARSVHFPIDVPADGEAKLTYTVKYSW